MSMRTRLSLAIGTVIIVTLLTFSAVIIRETQIVLTGQIDAQVRDFSQHMIGKPGPNAANGKPDSDSMPTPRVVAMPVASYVATPGVSEAPAASSTDSGPHKQDVAHFIYGANGELLLNQPSGYRENPDSPPDLPPIPSRDLDSLVGRVVTLPAVDGHSTYRVLIQHLPDGTYDVTAQSLANVDAAVGNIMRFLVLGGGVAVLAATLASWLLIRRGLRPVDRMVETATAIAGGDLSRRVPDADPRTELGRLGAALNEMLAQVEQAVQIRATSEERLRRFVADAAHELRTPLTSLRGYAELYRQGALATPDDVGRAMGRIESEGSRMARLVEDLLLLARLDQQRPLEREIVSLSDLADDAASDFHVANPDRPFTSRIEPHLRVMGDPLRMRQVIDNLLANAGMHTPATAAVELVAAREGRFVSISVRDEGPGINPQDQAHIFERFWRADPARTRSGGGSGLGLSITASLVAAQGGTIAVESEPGHGATFTIRFPEVSIATDSDADPLGPGSLPGEKETGEGRNGTSR